MDATCQSAALMAYYTFLRTGRVISLQGQRSGKFVQSQFKDLVPISHRKNLDDDERNLERPTEEEVQATTDKTRAAVLHGAWVKG